MLLRLLVAVHSLQLLLRLLVAICPLKVMDKTNLVFGAKQFCPDLEVQEAMFGLPFTYNYTLKRAIEGKFIDR
ncbi:hypothetical protein D2A66_10370 [Enterococcus faecalis]|nr:hypothetical protein [Enterococcus faecalis]EGO8833558.1 hypothetical protein [Enterococcus faecalis]EGO9019171.1 hypothetical protein [Enterococcus faecalis]EGO9059273.1 hypothetical protein [Enterococcus faecalis]EGO9148587.1 hypothetical protein [Enterococcus faecalis]